MNHIPSSSSSSATPPNLLVHPARSASNISSNTQSTSTLTPAIIPLDYNYQTMSPSSLSQFRNDCITSPVATNTNTSASYNLHPHSRLSSARPSGTVSVDVELDNQYSSLFGDPVPPPPPPDFLTTQFDPVTLFRPSSLDISSGSDEDATARLVSLETDRPANTRLFSNVPLSSLFSRRSSDTLPQRNFAVLPTPLPRLQPPDIQILPNSSGGSSSEAHESPNYALLTPDNVTRRHSVYDATDPTDVTEIIESLEVRDAKGVREYSEATRRVSNFSDDFKSNVGALSNTQETEIVDLPSTANHSFPHQFSNEYYASSEWFRPAAQDYPEFSKIPRLRPSSKNIMSIKREEMPMHHSPVAAMINDSNGSSSGEERLVDKAEAFEHENVALDILQPPERPPDPSPSLLREIETNLLLSPQGYLPQQTGRSIDSLNQQNFPTPPPPAAPPPPHFFTPSPGENEGSIRREMSPVILTDSIATGGDFRVDQPRLHKKTSFTIISDKSPQSSRTQSPSPFNQRSPSKISGLSNSSTIKPVAIPRQYLQQKSLSSIQLKLPQLPQQKFQGPADDSPRPSVQFNMTGRHTPNMMTQRGILQNRESLSSSQDITPMSPSAALTSASKLRRPAALPSFAKPANESKMKSCEALPLITCPYRTAIPRLNRSITDLHREPAVFPPGALPRPLKPNPNPTRKQKGLLRILNGDTSHIPLRSIWASMDDLALGRQLKTPLSTPIRELQARRRSSSTSPERRSSTQTASDRRSSNLSSITTSDFSFRRSSIAAQQQRRKTVCPLPSPKMKPRLSLIPGMSLTGGRTSRAKIAKPSTLSPIIGTPNKDSSTPQSPEQNGLGSLAPSETISDVTSQRDSFSKIPVRPHHSRPSSRSSSPLKEFTAQLPLADPNSRGTSSRTASRATAKTEASQSTSRANSRPVSRSTSRASTHPMSRAASRSSTRPNSRVEMAKDIANSRSSSKMSMRSVNSLARNSSPAPGKRSAEHSPLPIRRRKSISVSPVLNQRSRTRRQSLSPPNKKRSGSRGREKKMRERSESRHSSQSHIPLRAGSVTKPTRSSSKPGVVKQSKSRSPAKSKETKSMRVASPTRISPNQRTKTISAKKAQTSVHKPTSSAKRTPSSVSKQTTSVKKQPSDLQKTAGTSLRREVSNLQKKDATMIGVGKTELRESTIAATRIKRAGASGSAATVALAASGIKRQTTSKTLGKATTKRQVAVLKGKGIESKTNAEVGKETGNAKKDDAMTKLEEEKSANGKDTESNLTGSSPIGMEAAKAGAIPASVAAGVAASTTIRGSANISSGSTGGSGSTSTMKRQPSNVGLVRMASRMSLLSMKRSDSNLSKKTTVPSVAEETITTSKANGNPATLQKSNSRTQLRTPENASTLPAAILEKSQKTLENIQKTVTVATDEIQKTIHENLTDLKSFESDMGRQWSDSAGSPTSSIATVVENKAAGKAGGVGGVGGGGSGGGVGESISRSGTAEGSTTTAGAAKVSQKNGSSSVTPAAATQKSPLPPTQPIEADVSVLNATAHTTQHSTVAAAAAAAATTGAMTMPLAGAVDATVERVSERAISVMPEVDCDDANFQNFAYDGDGATDKTADGAFSTMLMSGEAHANVTGASGNSRKGVGNGEGGEGDGHGDGDHDIKRRSPDGQGGSAADSGNGSRELLKEQDDDSAPPTGCCRCCTKFCLPCRRLRCLRCCCRKKSKTGDESEEPVLLATSSASTTNLEVVDEARHSTYGKTKTSCWQKFNCCKRCRKQPKISAGSTDEHAKMTVMTKSETAAAAGAATSAPKQGKCGLCISKLFCCRRVNKVDPTTGDETELKKCCFCIPCRRKKTGRGAAIGSTVSPAGSVAWQDPESGIAATDASVLEGTTSAEMQPKQGCCKRFWSTLLCCGRNKMPKFSESRRASMKAPPPPSEDTRRKLHADLVEYNSKMKGAIPVLPLSLAWFCVICNTIFPGLGTLFSGIFCLCVGIPRFSQYDSAKARFGSFIINVIVATAQLFCVLFCFVGWGWSIWWGTIMLKCARKLHKIKKVERLEMEEERRQAEAAAVAAVTTTRVPANSGPNAASAPITTESSA